MKITYCSFADSDRPLGNGLFHCTVVILEGHHAPLAAADICIEKQLITGTNGEFYAFIVPPEHEKKYEPYVGRAMGGDEARGIFDAMSVAEWKEFMGNANPKAGGSA